MANLALAAIPVKRKRWSGQGDAASPIGVWIATASVDPGTADFPDPDVSYGGAQHWWALYASQLIQFSTASQPSSGLIYNLEDVSASMTISASITPNANALQGFFDPDRAQVSASFLPQPGSHLGIAAENFIDDPRGDVVFPDVAIPFVDAQERANTTSAALVVRCLIDSAPLLWLGQPAPGEQGRVRLRYNLSIGLQATLAQAQAAKYGYITRAMGYVWDAEAISAPGGPRRPIGSIFGSA